MTVKEIAELFDVSESTVKRIIHETFPEKMQNGKRTTLTKEEAVMIGEKIRKRGYITPENTAIQNAQVAGQNEQVMNRMDRFIESIEKLTASLIININGLSDRVAKVEKAAPLQITQDYYSILAYSNLKKIQITFSDALALGKAAAGESRARGLEIRRVPDERFGTVGAYHVSVLEKVFEV